MKWNFIWISRAQRILFKDTANEGKAQIKWNENKLWEKAKDIKKENVSLQYILITTSEKKKHGRNRQDTFQSNAQRVPQS
jgi:hypothetical protein